MKFCVENNGWYKLTVQYTSTERRNQEAVFLDGECFANVFLPKDKKINPMIGAAGISAFPMSARVVHKMGLEADNSNFLLMHAIGVNVSGQIASVIAGGLILNLIG